MTTNETDQIGGQREKRTTEPGDEDCALDRFVRNRFFHGKLMTARDMQLEQEYHADRLETLAQHVTGKGAVCGLAVSVEQESADDPLEVTVEPGYALDWCGRPVLVEDTAHETVPPEQLPTEADDRERERETVETVEELDEYLELHRESTGAVLSEGEIEVMHEIVDETDESVDAAAVMTVSRLVSGGDEAGIEELDTAAVANVLRGMGEAGGTSVSTGAGEMEAWFEELDEHAESTLVEVVEEISGEVPDLPTGVAVYVQYSECYTEKVPVNGSEDACREDCTYNRLVEDFEIVVDTEPPAIKPVGYVEFPDQDDLYTDVPGVGVAPTDPGLQIPAMSYTEDETRTGFQQRRCEKEGDPRVFLGYFALEGTEWPLVPDLAPRHQVYDNNMLYAAIVRHATDDGNPHDVVERIEGLGGHIGVTSPDRTLSIAADQSQKRVELTAGSWLESLGSYMADKALKTAVKSFSFAGLWFIQSLPDEVDNIEEYRAAWIDMWLAAARARDAIENKAYEDETAFLDAVRDIARVADRLASNSALENWAIDKSFQRFKTDVSDLTSYTSGFSDTITDETVAAHDSTQVAYDLDQLSEAAQWLTHLDTSFQVPDQGDDEEPVSLPFYIWLPLLLDFDMGTLQQFPGRTTGVSTTATRMIDIEERQPVGGVRGFTNRLAANMGQILESDARPVLETLRANNERYEVEVQPIDELDEATRPGRIVSHAAETVDDGQMFRVTIAGTPLTAVTNVGDDRSRKLAGADIYTAEELAKADVGTVASALSLDEGDNLPAELIENARSVVDQ